MRARLLPFDWSPARYWAVPAYLDYVQPPLTTEAIAAAEAQLGVRLSDVYLALLRHQNGGYTRGAREGANRVFGIGPNYPSITLDQAWWRPRKSNPGAWAPERPELLIPFDGDGHWDMCLDYRDVGPQGEPSVTLIDLEARRECPVAADFLAYLKGLEDDSTAGAIRVYGDLSVEQVARRLAALLGAGAPSVDSLSHGYPTWRIALPTGSDRWCWCTPNRVPAAFRRKGRTVELSPETALRLPEDPDCVALVSATDESLEAVAAAVAALT